MVVFQEMGGICSYKKKIIITNDNNTEKRKKKKEGYLVSLSSSSRHMLVLLYRVYLVVLIDCGKIIHMTECSKACA